MNFNNMHAHAKTHARAIFRSVICHLNIQDIGVANINVTKRCRPLGCKGQRSNILKIFRYRLVRYRSGIKSARKSGRADSILKFTLSPQTRMVHKHRGPKQRFTNVNKKGRNSLRARPAK